MIGIRMTPDDATRFYWCEQPSVKPCAFCGGTCLVPSRWEICLSCYEELTGCHDNPEPEPQER